MVIGSEADRVVGDGDSGGLVEPDAEERGHPDLGGLVKASDASGGRVARARSPPWSRSDRLALQRADRRQRRAGSGAPASRSRTT